MGGKEQFDVRQKATDKDQKKNYFNKKVFLHHFRYMHVTEGSEFV